MPETLWRVALIDSGIGADRAVQPVDESRFVDSGSLISQAPAHADRLGHGSLMAQIIASNAAPIELLNAQVFETALSTTAASVAAAIDWAAAHRAHLIHLSLGLREHRDVLEHAVSNAIAAGCLVVASTPARGQVSFPARYAGVIRATGDARCSPDEISALESPQADFGACPRHEAKPGAGGASVGAAHLTRFIVGRLRAGADASQIRSDLKTLARYQGPESKIR